MKVTTKGDEDKKAELNKQINKITRQEKINKNTEKIEEAVRKEKSLKLARDNTGKQQMLALKDKNGNIIQNRDELTKVTEQYYEKLYASQIKIPQTTKPIDTNDTPDITVAEVEFALENMKRGKATGNDCITTDLLKDARENLHKPLAQLFTQCIKEKKVQTNFGLGIVILLHKKGDKCGHKIT